MLSKLLRLLFGPGTDYKSLVEEGAVIVDVRTPEEFKTGHIRDSVNIPVNKIAGQAGKLKKQGKVVITCCHSGARSAMARSVLDRHGIRCYNGGSWNGLRKRLETTQ